MKKIKLSILLFCILITVACETTSNLCNVPEAQNSVVCALSQKLNTTPEMISQSLLVANFGALEADLYTAQQAEAFVDSIIAEIKDIQIQGTTISYLQAINYIDGKFKVLPAKVRAAFIIINPAGLANQQINLPLTDYDLTLLLRHLQKQKSIIEVYLK